MTVLPSLTPSVLWLQIECRETGAAVAYILVPASNHVSLPLLHASAL